MRVEGGGWKMARPSLAPPRLNDQETESELVLLNHRGTEAQRRVHESPWLLHNVLCVSASLW